MPSKLSNRQTPPPRYRRLRAFAFDPILSRRIESYDINQITIDIPWESNVNLGPVDNYLEVVDYDPASQVFYSPVNLNDKHLLAQDGLPPSEGNPQFHQQMVFTVARTTIGHFEQALGRRSLWSPRDEGSKTEFVERLRVYPHGLREANAYYSPIKKALLFGYFPASTTVPGENMPGEMVFTCLSHDIVAHETTHALLDGLHRRFIEATNSDVLALHEAFADIVALFQHFTYPEALRRQIARTRGDLQSQNLLGELAYQFGQAIGSYGALRSALGRHDPQTNEWIPEKPDQGMLLSATEPHERGAILVAAVFEAFLTIYRWRIADLLRIASGGSGQLPPGELHPDLVQRLAQEAAKTAGHILHMCIRALDYCPPVDVDFGDYLRALITADADLVISDRFNYRLAVVDAFRRRGIYPLDVRNLSTDSLLWQSPDSTQQKAFLKVFRNPARLRKLVPDWGLTTNRKKIYEQARNSQKMLHSWFTDASASEAADVAQIVLDRNAPEAFYRDKEGVPALEIHSVRPARRIGPGDQTVTELVIEMTQRRRGYNDPEIQDRVDRGVRASSDPPEPDFIYRGGCTLLVNPDNAEVRYCIQKRIRSETRLERVRRYLTREERPSLRSTYLGGPLKNSSWSFSRRSEDLEHGPAEEPFALFHRYFGPEEVK